MGESVKLVDWGMDCAPPSENIDIVVPPFLDTLTFLPRLAEVRTRIGVSEILPLGCIFCNAASVHETATAEFALALVLASQRGLADFIGRSRRGEWKFEWNPGLADRVVLLVGYGGVGRAIESRLLPFEARVIRVAKTPRDDQNGTVLGSAELPSLLPEADIVIVCVALSQETRHFVDEAFLSKMKTGALLVNIARGPVVDTTALVEHAQSGRLRAALDVTEPEPLPMGHPLYAMPNVIITPHVGAATAAMLPRMARLLRNQIDLMLSGRPPLNVVLRT